VRYGLPLQIFGSLSGQSCTFGVFLACFRQKTRRDGQNAPKEALFPVDEVLAGRT
jgi:hypothetical protein